MEMTFIVWLAMVTAVVVGNYIGKSLDRIGDE